jgi:hypothetical protein
MNPHSLVQQPLYAVSFVLVIVFFGRIHKLLQFQISQIHTKLQLRGRNPVAGLICPKKFLKNQVPVRQLIKDHYVVVFDLVRCTVQEPPRDQDDLGKDSTQFCLQSYVYDENPVVACSHPSREERNRRAIQAGCPLDHRAALPRSCNTA